MKNIEQELKLQLTEREYRLLSDVACAEPRLQSNFYFVCPAMPRDAMVRIREKGDVYVLGYKRRLSVRDSVSVCDERECELSAEHANYILDRGVTADEMRKLLQVRVEAPLRLAGRLDTYRTVFEINGWTLELDKNVYLGVTDYELECENNDVSELAKLKNYLFYTYGVPERPSKPKSERFFDALNK